MQENKDGAELAAVDSDTTVVQTPQLPHADRKKDPMNLRIFRADNGQFCLYGEVEGEFGSGWGDTPEDAMRQWVRSRNTDARPMWPLRGLA